MSSGKSKVERCKYIMANWVGNIAINTIDTCPGIVKHLFRQKVKIIKDDFYVTSMANVCWYKPHLERYSPKHRIEIFIADLFEMFGPFSFSYCFA